MGGDAFLFLFFWFCQTNKKQQQEKILIPQATQIVLNLFLFKDFFPLRLTLDFVKEQLIETMLQHLCPGWNAHAKCTEFVCFVCLFSFVLNGSAV